MKKLSMTLVTGSILLFIILISFAAADGFPTIVETKYGKVQGFQDEGNVLVWKGIPYAKPPVGKFRWKAPVSPDPWSGIKQADDFCDICPQNDNLGNFIGSEDCLNLNVWRPDSEETDLPVYFWIHGGRNSKGSASQEVPGEGYFFSGANIAQKSKLVVVTINYRLGPLGWLTHPALRRGQGETLSNSGNFGTLDIIKALKWVKGNIEAFGGDSQNITIAGESAGGYNVLSLIISPLAGKHKLFHKAISQSGALIEKGEGFDNSIIISEIATGEEHAKQLILKLLDKDYSCGEDEAQNILANMTDNEIRRYLYGKSAEDILHTYDPGMYKFPHCFKDGIVIHKDGSDAFLHPEEYNQVPMIIGNNKEEQKIFMCFAGYWPNNPDPAIVYQDSVEWLNENLWQPFGVDKIAEAITVHPSQPDVFAYRFDYGAYNYIYDETVDDIIPNEGGFNAWPVDDGGPNLALLLGASHTLDVPFFMGNFFFLSTYFTDLIFNDEYSGYKKLSEAMMAYVKNFAYTGNPNGLSLPIWDPWSNKDEGSKRILLDADDDEYKIEMSSE